MSGQSVHQQNSSDNADQQIIYITKTYIEKIYIKGEIYR